MHLCRCREEGSKCNGSLCLLFSANYITVLLRRQFNDMNTVVGPTMVDTVPQVLKSSRHIIKVRGKRNPSHLVDSQWFSANPPVPESSFFGKNTVNVNLVLTVVLLFLHITIPSGHFSSLKALT